MTLLSSINILLFLIYAFFSKTKRFLFVEPYIFFWLISFFSFEISGYILDAKISDDAKLSYYTFFIPLTTTLISISRLKLASLPIATNWIKKNISNAPSSYFNVLFFLMLSLFFLQLISRWATGALVTGLPEKVSGGSNPLFSAINYFCYLFGFHHTGYMNYTGFLSVAMILSIKNQSKAYVWIASIILIATTLITTQKTYFLFLLISILVFWFWQGRVSARRIFIVSLVMLTAPAAIFFMNSIRYSMANQGTGLFDYFSIETIVWYLAVRLDFSQSTDFLLGSNFETSYQFIVNMLKTTLFILPKSLLYGEKTYAIALAEHVGLSNDGVYGITVTPYSQIYSHFGIIGNFAFALIAATLYSAYSKILQNKISAFSIISFFMLMPFFYSNLYSQALHESIYNLFRNILSFNLLILTSIIIWSTLKSIRR